MYHPPARTRKTNKKGQLSAAEERRQWTAFIDGPGAVEKESKFGAKRTDGYASRREADHATKLHALAKAGQIWNLKEQVWIELVEGDDVMRGIRYVADFVYDAPDGHHVIDCKGYPTPEYILKRKLAWLLKGIRIEEV